MSVDLDVALAPESIAPDTLKGRTVVVVDVLCTGSVVATALANGARAVLPAADPGDAIRLAAPLGRELALLGGERGGEPVSGYAAHVSPTDYAPDLVAGKTVVLSTSDGTPTIRRAGPAARLVVGSFLNARRVTDEIRRALTAGEPVTILCAGDRGRISLEDTLCAGLLVGRAVEAEEAAQLGDGAQIARALYSGSQDRLAEVIGRARSTRVLAARGLADVVAACARVDVLDVLPVVRENRITAETA